MARGRCNSGHVQLGKVGGWRAPGGIPGEGRLSGSNNCKLRIPSRCSPISSEARRHRRADETAHAGCQSGRLSALHDLGPRFADITPFSSTMACRRRRLVLVLPQIARIQRVDHQSGGMASHMRGVINQTNGLIAERFRIGNKLLWPRISGIINAQLVPSTTHLLLFTLRRPRVN